MRFAVSQDGYVRCTHQQLLTAGLIHRISGLDEDPQQAPPDTVLSSGITGYTEWIDGASAVVTVGWDWKMSGAGSGVSLTRTSEPRSNVMLIDANGTDLGPAGTTMTLAQLLGRFDWQSVVRSNISARYKSGGV
jgi:Domain of unknown function (DUF4902)